VPSQNIRFDPIGERLANPYVKAAVLSVVVIAVGFAAMYWWLFIRPTPPGGLAKKPVPVQGPPRQIAAAPVTPPELVLSLPAPSEPTPAAGPKGPTAGVAPAPDKGTRGQAPAGAESPAPAPARAEPPKVQPAAATAKTSSGRTIKLRFKGESWVEIRDGQGRVLLSQINAPGSETQVSGRPPLTIVVGNAPDVQMLVNDREFSLEPHTKVAVARFTLD
jgi:cytoskeleton protein RodZ